MTNTRRPEHAFLATSALVFVASTAVTIAWCSSMAAMPGMAMPGGWTMSMTWMRMPGQSWSAAAATFLGMWCVMMVAMMLPALVPTLVRYRQAVGRSGTPRLGWLTTLVGAGYFAVWTAFGIVAYPVGIALAGVAMRHPTVALAGPLTAGIVVTLAGVLQFTAWKARQLACCRNTPAGSRPGPVSAFRYGWRLGVSCVRCCLGQTAILLCLGVMDLPAMALVALAITLERFSPAAARVVPATGVITIVGGLWLIVLSAA